MNRLIALTGYKGSGKTTVATHLCQSHGYARRPFAGPLKNMLRAIGLAESHVDGVLKEEPVDLLCGATTRHAMQTLGTEWGRNTIHPDIWVTLWTSSIQRLSMKCVTDDLRFPNEADAVRALGGVVVRIDRPGTAATDHASESSIDLVTPDHVVVNTGDLGELYATVLAAVA